MVRTLADYYPPMSASDLVRRSGASTGATYRVLDFLDQGALITRSRRGVIETTQWRPLLERWSEDFGFQESNRVTRFLQPRGISALVAGLTATRGLTYAVTGSLAAARLSPYAPTRLAMVYVDDAAQAAAALGLRAVDTGANVLLGVPSADVVFDRADVVEGSATPRPARSPSTC